ncbi:hypothetical protein [Qipengyuania sp.]|uniref:hypothetical protein n=1 Tax=Qipengyuania sp. TaxID=2004515 RepID=UPI0035180F49
MMGAGFQTYSAPRMEAEVRFDKGMTVPIGVVGASIILLISPTSASGGTMLSRAAMQHTSPINPPFAREEDVTVENALLDVKERAGLAWKDVALLLGVTPRAIYDWLKGAGVSEKNQAALFGLRDRVQQMDGEPRFRIRNALVGDQGAGLPERFRTVTEFDQNPLREKPAAIEKNTLKIAG